MSAISITILNINLVYVLLMKSAHKARTIRSRIVGCTYVDARLMLIHCFGINGDILYTALLLPAV